MAQLPDLFFELANDPAKFDLMTRDPRQVQLDEINFGPSLSIAQVALLAVQRPLVIARSYTRDYAGERRPSANAPFDTPLAQQVTIDSSATIHLDEPGGKKRVEHRLHKARLCMAGPVIGHLAIPHGDEDELLAAAASDNFMIKRGSTVPTFLLPRRTGERMAHIKVRTPEGRTTHEERRVPVRTRLWRLV